MLSRHVNIHCITSMTIIAPTNKVVRKYTLTIIAPTNKVVRKYTLTRGELPNWQVNTR